jgi:predicted DCC family thiol-disulfide oxidoreductase YuxK
VCSAEIGHYRTLDATRSIDWCDVAGEPSSLEPHGVGVEEARRRLHVVDEDGRLHRGVGAFLVLWRAMPRYRRLSSFVGNGLVRPVAEMLYEGVLAPLLYGWDRRRRLANQRRGG